MKGRVYISNGVAWTHADETTGEWEEWKLRINGCILCVRRIDPNTKLAPSNFARDEWDAEYQVKWDWELVATLPLDTPLDEVLARAIAEVRLG